VTPWYWQRWQGETVAILASGPSMCAEDAAAVEAAGVKAIAVNSTWQAAPWANVHYSSDADWWQHNLPAMRKACAGEFFTGHNGFIAPDVRQCPYRKGAMGLWKKPGAISWGGNSGHCAIGLAYQFGARRIILLGFDQQGEHWHSEHPAEIRKPPNWPMWAERFSLLARDLAAVGVEVVNASRETSLECFRRISLAEALRC
jgi:hypothetical protein